MVSNGKPIIEVCGITKTFPGVKALDNVSLTVYPGKIHAIVGENGAGKSTLMNILVGQLQPDKGIIKLYGEPIKISNPSVALKAGISVVSQELALCPNLTIAENISLWKANDQFGIWIVPRKKFREQAKALLSELGLSQLDVDVLVKDISVAKQQLVEIAKAISTNAKVLILDEPNSALTRDETQHVFQIIRQLRDNGVAVLYISHHLDEILEISDEITVLRDGKLISNIDRKDATVDILINRMVGRDICSESEILPSPQNEVLFEVKNLFVDGELDEISFKVQKGEIVGVAGLPDSRKDELGKYLFGLEPIKHGSIEVHGIEKKITSPQKAIDEGMVFIPADRRQEGAILMMSVRDNIIVSSLSKLSSASVIHSRKSYEFASEYQKKLDVRLASLAQRMANLSGGNQQKAILARGLATSPSFIIVHEPTRGIDIGAKTEIYQIIRNLAKEGVGILIISSELNELICNCHRILVMYEGRITGDFSQKESDQELIMACATGQMQHLG
ncbi:MAG: sugar ABC transporter ATP-binding protein [Flexilinea sp.]